MQENTVVDAEYGIAEYSETEASLAKLRDDYAGAVFDVATTDGMTHAKKARMELRSVRTTLEAKRKEIKKPALDHCKMIDAEAKRITEEIKALEDPIDGAIKTEEERKAMEKLAKAKAEKARVDGIMAKIQKIKESPMEAMNGTTQWLKDKIISLGEEIYAEEDYQEFTADAIVARDLAVVSLESMLESRLAHDLLQKRHEEEQAKLKADREELERKQKEQAEAEIKAQAEADEIARKQREAQERIDAKEKEIQDEKDRIEAEERAKVEAEAEAKRVAEQKKTDADLKKAKEKAKKELEKRQAEEKKRKLAEAKCGTQAEALKRIHNLATDEDPALGNSEERLDHIAVIAEANQ